jgi:5-formyltetrahydrofolate cyclo-ligase
MSAIERAVASRHITDRLFRAHEFTSAASIACFLPMEDEVDTYPVFARAWRAKKRIFAPVIDRRGKMAFRRLDPETRLYRNSFGLWEPASQETIDPRQLDLVLTPLVAFDKNNNRIGMGGGYFDRCFAFLKPRRHWLRPKLFGLAFAVQEVEKIVPNPWDIRLYGIATQTTISRL